MFFNNMISLDEKNYSHYAGKRSAVIDKYLPSGAALFVHISCYGLRIAHNKQ